LDDKTLTVFITNGLFMALKLNDTQTTTATDKNIFLSAYLTRRIQYNDVDPDKVIETEGFADIYSDKSGDNASTDVVIELTESV
jgi:hypothetical protein